MKNVTLCFVQLESLMQQLEALQSENSELEKKNTKLKNAGYSLRAKNFALDTGNKELEADNSTLQTENNNLRTENNKLITENAVINEDIEAFISMQEEMVVHAVESISILCLDPAISSMLETLSFLRFTHSFFDHVFMFGLGNKSRRR